jgi:hypothetical protein
MRWLRERPWIVPALLLIVLGIYVVGSDSGRLAAGFGYAAQLAGLLVFWGGEIGRSRATKRDKQDRGG